MRPLKNNFSWNIWKNSLKPARRGCEWDNNNVMSIENLRFRRHRTGFNNQSSWLSSFRYQPKQRMFGIIKSLWLLSNKLNKAEKSISYFSQATAAAPAWTNINMHTIMCNNLPKNTHFCLTVPLFRNRIFSLSIVVCRFTFFFITYHHLNDICFPTKPTRDQREKFAFGIKWKRAQNYQITAKFPSSRQVRKSNGKPRTYVTQSNDKLSKNKQS